MKPAPGVYRISLIMGWLIKGFIQYIDYTACPITTIQLENYFYEKFDFRNLSLFLFFFPMYYLLTSYVFVFKYCCIPANCCLNMYVSV